MELSHNSSIDPSVLVGALITNENGADFKVIGLELKLPDFEPVLMLQQLVEFGQLSTCTVGVPLANTKGWVIQLTQTI
jgi:hypothetical protein